jgi:ABC-type multidrug transport system ATPase subunit
MITVSNLNYTYPGQQHPAVDGISFDVKQGEIFGFLGPSGAGKSTTQKILIRLLQGYRGKVSVKGRNSTDCRRITTTRSGWVLNCLTITPGLQQWKICGSLLPSIKIKAPI